MLSKGIYFQSGVSAGRRVSRYHGRGVKRASAPRDRINAGSVTQMTSASELTGAGVWGREGLEVSVSRWWGEGRRI